MQIPTQQTQSYAGNSLWMHNESAKNGAVAIENASSLCFPMYFFSLSLSLQCSIPPEHILKTHLKYAFQNRCQYNF